MKAEMEKHLRALFNSAKKNAKTRGIEFQLTLNDMLSLGRKSGGRCALTGIEFSFASKGYKFRRPWVPSVDRIDSHLPYVKGNCRLVCSSVNIAMNEWGAEIFERLVFGYCHTTLKRAIPRLQADALEKERMRLIARLASEMAKVNRLEERLRRKSATTISGFRAQRVSD